MKKVKIVATIGPVSSDEKTLTRLIKSGVNVIRLNMSHGDHKEQMERIETVRKINSDLGTHVGILMDTKGPEVRTGLFKEEKVLLKKGNEVIITMDEVEGTAEKFTVSYKGLAKDLKPKDIVLLDDGYVSVKVKDIKGNDIICEVLNTGYLKDRRGVNVPGVTLSFDFMSQKDKEDIIWACENDLDYIAASFVRNKEDLEEIYEVINGCENKKIQVISKIESQDGVENVDDIIAGGDGIMVARGDLGVEVPAEDVPVIQKSIIEKCNKRGKVVITATQMLESMQSNPRPTRAEVSDVFNAIMDGTDAVMLSGESAAGEYPVESVKMQATIAKKAEKVFDYEAYLDKMNKKLDKTVSDLVSYSTVATADKLKGVKLIIAITNSGATAKKISRLKPKTPILAVTPSSSVARKLALNFAVSVAVIKKQETTDDLLEVAIKQAKELQLIKEDDYVAISAGSIQGKGNTDLMKIRKV